jgi:hypothetical protein
MPILFISLHEEFIYLIQKQTNYTALCMNIQDYIPVKKTYYVCASNVLCYFDRGFEHVISTIIFPHLETKVKKRISIIGKKNKIGSYYLPIGSSLIQSHDTDENKKVIISPIMLLPQNVSNTLNAYYATMAILYNIIIIQKENVSTIDILFTSFCCDDIGNMTAQYSIDQIIQGIMDYTKYINHTIPGIEYNDSLIREICLNHQPKYYQNNEWFHIPILDIVYPSKYKIQKKAPPYLICTLSFFLYGYINKEKKKEQEFCFIEKKKCHTTTEAFMSMPLLVQIQYYEIYQGKKRLID